MPDHSAGVTQAEVDVFDAVDIGETRTLGVGHIDRVAAGPLGHPRHRNSTHHRPKGLLVADERAGVVRLEGFDLLSE